MPKYRVTAESFINGVLYAATDKPGAHKVGDVVEYDGEVGPNLQPIDASAEAVVNAVRAVPKIVSDLVGKIRLHAATRGVPPSEANEDDIAEVLAVIKTSGALQPSAETSAAARQQLGLSSAVDLS